MTQEDKYTIIGKAHEDYREAKENFSAIQIRGQHIAEAARNLAEAILEPTRVVVPQGDEGVILAGMRNPFVFGAEVARQFTPDYVRQHVAEYRTAKQRLDALRQQLINLGQGDPERKGAS